MKAKKDTDHSRRPIELALLIGAQSKDVVLVLAANDLYSSNS